MTPKHTTDDTTTAAGDETDAPTVSVVLPTYERAGVLPRAIDSVLAQTLENLELIVVDDASTDETASVVRSYRDPRVTYRSHETNRGGSAARNTGIDAASGEYIAFIDSDDEWLPTKLERQVSRLRSHSDEWIAAYCDYRTVRHGRTKRLRRALRSVLTSPPATTEGGEELVPLLLAERFDHGGASTLLVRSEAVDAIDGFDEAFRRNQDIEFLVRLLKRGRLAYVDEFLVRKHQYDSPSADAVIDGKRELLRAFDDEIEAAEAQGIGVMDVHWYKLGLYSLRDGQFGQGMRYLWRLGVPGVTQAVELAWATALGVGNRLQRSAETG